MRPIRGMLVVLGRLLVWGAVSRAEVGGPIEVAPRAKGTQMQMWPRAAWAAESKSWLVVWREGYVNQEATDVWCARVSGRGRALDPAGIRVTKAKDRQERAVVASDGKGWLVVWEDFRNGKDYDVYAARVSGGGKVLDPAGFLVAGGVHNQCRPSVAFAGGNYVVAWQAFVGEPPDGTMKGGVRSGYKLFGTVVSPAGRVMVPRGPLLDPPDLRHALRPEVIPAVDGRRALVGFNGGGPRGPRNNNIGTLWMDGASGKRGQVHWQKAPGYNKDELSGSHLAMAWGKEGGLIFCGAVGEGAVSDFRVYRMEATGARVMPYIGFVKRQQGGFAPWYSIVGDGERYLVTRDRVMAQKPLPVLGVQASFLPADWNGGDLEKGFFNLAGDRRKSCLQGQVAAGGPKGSFLVTYIEARGVDDVKVLARVVRAKQEDAAPRSRNFPTG